MAEGDSRELAERCCRMDDEELIRELKYMADRERRNLAGLLVHLAECDHRRLYREAGYASLFMYCVKVLGYDENAAFRRITAARVIRRYPDALALVASGNLTLTSLLILSPVLSEENHDKLFVQSKGRSRRELETLAAGVSPLPARPDLVRRCPAPPPAWGLAPGSVSANSSAALPTGGAGSEPSAPLQPIDPPPPREWQAIVPLAVDRVRIGFDAAICVMRLVERARQVLRHKYPEGRLEDVLREALELLLDRKDPQRRLAASAASLARERRPAAPAPPAEPRFLRAWKAGRYIPARVKQQVWRRDEGRCAWRFPDGTPCGSRDWLEFDHVRPYAKGGRSDDPRNVRLLCRAHNRQAAEAVFGADAVRGGGKGGA